MMIYQFSHKISEIYKEMETTHKYTHILIQMVDDLED